MRSGLLKTPLISPPLLTGDERSLLVGSALFSGFAGRTLESVLACLKARRRTFNEGECLIPDAIPRPSACAIICGRVERFMTDIEGRRSLIDVQKSGDCFVGDCPGSCPLRTNWHAVARSRCSLILLDLERIFSADGCRCAYRQQVTDNLLRLMAEHNRFLMLKTEILSQKSLRGKLAVYLCALAESRGTNRVELPFNRTDLADFLCADRSALSREIGRMSTQGLLRAEKNELTILSDLFSQRA